MKLVDLETYVTTGDIPMLKQVVVELEQMECGLALLKMALMAKQMDVIYWVCSEYYEPGCNLLYYMENNEMCALAILYGNLESLRFMHEEHNHPLPVDACGDAAWINDIDKLKYLHDHGCPLTTDTMLLSIEGNMYETSDVSEKPTHIPVLQYLYDNNCPWDEQCTALAARCGVYMLEFLHTHGYPWNETVIQNAIQFKNMTGLRYAYEHGCPYDMSKYHDHIMRLI
jgi:hypothetical protein